MSDDTDIVAWPESVPAIRAHRSAHSGQAPPSGRAPRLPARHPALADCRETSRATRSDSGPGGTIGSSPRGVRPRPMANSGHVRAPASGQRWSRDFRYGGDVGIMTSTLVQAVESVSPPGRAGSAGDSRATHRPVMRRVPARRPLERPGARRTRDSERILDGAPGARSGAVNDPPALGSILMQRSHPTSQRAVRDAGASDYADRNRAGEGQGDAPMPSCQARGDHSDSVLSPLPAGREVGFR